MKPKFNLGDEAKFFKDSDALAGKVLSYSYDSNLETFRYVISAKQVNIAEDKVDEAVRHCLEDELVKVGTEPVLDKVVENKKDE